MAVDLAAAASLASGIFGLFKKKKSPGDAARSQIAGSARGAREAGEKYGFSPLTLLGLGQGASAGEWGAPPLASFDLISGGLDRLQTSKREQAEQDRAELENDLLRIELDKLRSGVVATDAVGQGPSPLGQRSTTVGNVNVRSPSVARSSVGQGNASGVWAPGPLGDPWFVDRPLEVNSGVDPRRPVSNEPVRSHAGFFEINSPWAPFPMYVPTLDGDEALQWYEYPSLAIPVATGALAYAGNYISIDPKEGYARDGIPLGADGPMPPRKPKARPIPTNNILTRVFDPFSRDGYTYR